MKEEARPVVSAEWVRALAGLSTAEHKLQNLQLPPNQDFSNA